jgi:hypothetical protein
MYLAICTIKTSFKTTIAIHPYHVYAESRCNHLPISDVLLRKNRRKIWITILRSSITMSVQRYEYATKD